MTPIYANTHFLRIISGSTASGFATWGFVFLLGLTVVSGELTAGQLGITLGARTVGFLFGVLFGGLLADTLSRRAVIIWSSMISMLGILFVILGLETVIIFTYLGAILAGIGQGGCRPAYQALVPMVVETNNLQSANAWMGLSIRIVTLLGPTITSMIVLFFGAMPAYVLLLVMWLTSALSPPKIEEKTTEPITKHVQKLEVITDLLDGIAEAKKHPWFIWSLVALTLVIAFGYSATNVILPIMSKQIGSVGLMAQSMTAYACGGLAGAVMLSRFKPKSVGWMALVGMASYGLAPLSLLFADVFFMQLPMIVLLAYFISGLGIEAFNVLWFTSIQREVPKSHLARVSSLDFLCSYGLAPLGLAIIAPIAESAGTTTVLIACAIVTLFAPLFVMCVPSRRHYSVPGARKKSD